MTSVALLVKHHCRTYTPPWSVDDSHVHLLLTQVVDVLQICLDDEQERPQTSDVRASRRALVSGATLAKEPLLKCFSCWNLCDAGVAVMKLAKERCGAGVKDDAKTSEFDSSIELMDQQLNIVVEDTEKYLKGGSDGELRTLPAHFAATMEPLAQLLR